MPRPPKLRNPDEPDVVLTQAQLDALQKEFGDRKREHPPKPPVDLEDLYTMPEGHYDELNRQIDEWQKYLDNLPQGEDEENTHSS
jgi:hypothetical protein